MKFGFEKFGFDETTGEAEFCYGFQDGRKFVERVRFQTGETLSSERREVLQRALELAFMLLGASYYKTFPTRDVEVGRELDAYQADFFNHVYHEGLGQFAFENGLARADLAEFCGEGERKNAVSYDGRGDAVLQSGGKDSLLVTSWLEKTGQEFAPVMVTSGEQHPQVLDDLRAPLVTVRRQLDLAGLQKAADEGGLNGHVPVTYMMMALGLCQAILLGKNRVMVSIGHEGAEANTQLLDGMEVNHQWSKSWQAEQDFARYVRDYISPDLYVGSPLRSFSEMRVTEFFAREAWERFGRRFSSCNVANYRQQADNSELKWCGNCPKCANSYLIFAPFVAGDELRTLFGGQELFTKESLTHAFKGLLGVDGVMKPFECVGEVDELRRAYHLAQARGEYDELPFKVPESDFEWRHEYEAQDWARELMRGIE